MSLRIGALFAGYGGLDMAVMDTLDAGLAWYAELDKAPAKVMAHHHPDVPNLWDVTKVDWAAVEPVDIITGGSPCQDLSHAGKRKGMTDGTRSNLWAEMREAIAVHRPRLVVWENVRGALSAHADSDLEPCPRCVGGADVGGTVLRALGRVLGDLSELGYDARWYGLRAADVGGAHGRFRVFVIAHPVSDSERGGLDGWALDSVGRPVGGAAVAGRGEVVSAGLTLLPTPRVSQAGYADDGRGGKSLDVEARALPVALLPTPAVNDMGAAYTPEEWDAWTERMKSRHGNGNGHGASLAIEAQRLLPTPEASRAGGTAEMHLARKLAADGSTRTAVTNLDVLAASETQDWRQYEAAIRRAEHATGRTAPAPTETGPKGKPRLSPTFVEWLMMLTAGHVTNPDIGLTRNEQLKALGNGVVPAQAAAALRAYIHDERQTVA